MFKSYSGKLSYLIQVTSWFCYMLFSFVASPQLEHPLISFTYTRKYGPLCWPSATSCGGLLSLANFFPVTLRKQKTTFVFKFLFYFSI